jgi:hypothetical protein
MRNASLQYVDPYDFWASGDPVPMGYRDQNHTVHGPFVLDYRSIRQKWLDLDGKPGSPLDDDGKGIILGQKANDPLSYFRKQHFEHGVIVFESGWGTDYYPYTETYLPDVRAADADVPDWHSMIVVRNNGDYSATVNVTFYTDDGRVLDSRTHTSVPARGVWTLNVHDALLDFLNQAEYHGVFEGSAIVYASHDVSVVVKTIGPQEVTGYGGLHATSAFGFSAPGSRLYAPYVFKHFYPDAPWHSVLRVQNTGTAPSQVRVRYRGLNGLSQPSWVIIKEIAPGAAATFDPDEMGDIPSDWLGSGFITSLDGQPLAAQPLAAVVETRSERGDEPERRTTYLAPSRGGTAINLPLILREYYGFTTGFQVLNTTGDPATITAVRYYNTAGEEVWARTNIPLPARGAATFDQAEDPLGELFVGSVRIEASRAVVVAVNQAHSGHLYALDYTGFDGGGQVLRLPIADYNYPGGWWSGFIVQNVGGGTPTVTVRYYDTGGTQVDSESKTLGAYEAWSPPPAPLGFNGSAVVEATQDVAVVVNHRKNSYGAMSYNGCD